MRVFHPDLRPYIFLVVVVGGSLILLLDWATR